MRFPVRRGVTTGVVACLCGLACALGAGVAPGAASAAGLGAFQFGEEGEGAGQVSHPTGVAVNNDPSSLFYGDVYVADYGNRRLDRFSCAGAFQLAWGWGVANGANELQTCTAACQSAPREESIFVPRNTGAVSTPVGVAVDSGSLSPSTGDVYLVQGGETNRVEKFGPSGEFLLMFGGDVNETTSGDVCNAGERCKRGTAGHANGEFEDLSNEGTQIAVGPGGSVYVGDRARVQVFEPSGVWRETISLASLSSTGDVTALAVNEVGDIFLKDSEVSGVREFEPDGVEEGTQFDVGGTAITGVALDGSGDMFVGEFSGDEEKHEGHTHVLKYKTATGKATGSFGSGAVRGFSGALTFSETSDTVYATEYHSLTTTEESSSVWALPVPPPGPSIESESAILIPPGGVLLEGSVSPEGGETQYHFEYVDEANFRASGFAHATSTTAGLLPASIEAQAVQAHVAGLPTSESFYYRLVASNAESISPAIGQERTFQSLPAATIGGEFVTDVASSSVTLTMEVNALGSSTEYSLEYGTGGASEHTVTGSVGNGTTDIPVSRHLQELAAATTYHYRFMVHNALGTVAGSEQAFMTQSEGGSSAPIDGRTWEMVSPVDKHGALLELQEHGGDVQAASDGSGITYMSTGGSPGESPAGKVEVAQILSKRNPSGWSTQDLTLPSELPENGNRAEKLFYDRTQPAYHLFSPNLSLTAVQPSAFGTPLLSPEATEDTLYLRDNDDGGFIPLVTSADVPPSTQIDEPTANLVNVEDFYNWVMQLLAATPDLSHVVFETPMALTENAIHEESAPEAKEHYGSAGEPAQNLYEWSSEGSGKVQLVNVLPGTEGVAHGRKESTRVALAGVAPESVAAEGGVERAVSSNGQRIAWTWGGVLYVRDMAEEKTVRLGGIYQTMNAEGTKIFYLVGGDLYVYDWEVGQETGKAIDLTSDHGSGETSGGVAQLAADVSENGAYVYFVASGVLAQGAVRGADNLYVLHEAGSNWTTSYIATLSSADEPDWHAEGGIATSRVSPDGRYLAFLSNRSLTGYDNRDAVNGEADEEVYLYDAQTGKLVCASCDPTGARPDGVYDENGAELLVDRGAILAGAGSSGTHALGHWLAGSVPGWDALSGEPVSYQPRYLSDSGRLFFDSPVGLVSQDTNGLEDVYEFEPEGVGNCTTATSSAAEVYVKEVDGRAVGSCVGLISSGTSSSESAFYDASENGNDVFFDTTSRLAPADVDDAYDIYDAHVCSSAVPCRSAPVPSPPCDTGDSCKAAASPQPTIFGAPASATFNGAGNVASASSIKTVGKKRAQCAKGKKRRGGKCVKRKAKAVRKTGRAGGERRAKS
jgi:hypothetical protein